MPDEADWRFRALNRIIHRGEQLADRAVDAEITSIFSAWLAEADGVVSLFPGTKGSVTKGFNRASEGDLERLAMLRALESGAHPYFNMHMWVYFITSLH